MAPQERDFAYLWDMRAAARLVSKFIRGATHTQFASDEMMQSAVERQLELIG